MMDTWIWFVPLLFLVAWLYASVGHGGASGYLALMAISGMAPAEMKPAALLLNLFVSLTAFYHFQRAGHFQWRYFLPLAAASVPCAFLGGLLEPDAEVYRKVLGIILLVSVARLLTGPAEAPKPLRSGHTALALLIGAVIGFLSGLLGIGGGILLSPLLLLLRWHGQKQTAAISSLFIFVNSLSGLGGQAARGFTLRPEMAGYIAVAFAGGLLGARAGAGRNGPQALRITLAIVLCLAALKLLFT